MESSLEFQEFVPERAGILVVGKTGRVKAYRKPKAMRCRALTVEETLNVVRLASMRIWNLKEKLLENR